MTLRQKPTTKLQLKGKFALLFITGCGVGAFIISLFTANIGTTEKAFAAAPYETMDSGSYIINMGIVPQTYANGLKPYGMVYDLIKNYNTQVKWVIDTTKAKDAKDFTYNGVDYRGAPFIIPAQFITATVKTRITYWTGLGVTGLYTTSAVSVPVYATLTCIPRMTIDDLSNNVNIIGGYFTNASIPSSAYQQGPPDSLSTCHDLWVNPHGDPVWSTHSRLYNFATVDGSFIFSECHATSMMEGAKNPVSPFQQLNFLTTNGLKCYSNNKCLPGSNETHAGNPTSPKTCNYPGDPVMQFMGFLNLGGGSEEWYQPNSTGGWRSTTKRSVVTADGTSPNEGVQVVYGPAFGLANSGYAMYMGSHALDGNGSTAEKVAAQRVFFNYMLFATTIKSLKFTSVTVPPTFSSNDTRTVSVTVSSGNPTYSYQWTSTVSGGSFANANSATTTYTTPTTPVLIKGVLTCQVTDACGRKNFIQRPIVIDPSALPVNLLSFTAYADKMNKVKLSWITSSEKDNDYFTIERSSDGRNFTELKKIAGAGTTNEIKKYYLTDENPVKGTSYYLLRQTDYNGKSETFKTIAVSIKASSVNNISIYPNPFITFFTAEFNAVDDEVVQIQLIGLDGSLIHSDKFEAVMGRNAYRFMPEEPLKPGTYILRLSNGKEVFGAVKVNSRNN